MFRREKPQALRYRQHTQFGAELYGSTNPEADAEVILLGCAVVEAMGIREPSVRLNSIGCGICRPAYRTSLIDYYQGRRDELCHDCQTRLESNPLRLLDCKVDVGIRNEAPDIQDYWCEDCRAHYQKLDDLLKKAGRIVRRDPYLVRGLDYYTRTVFEIGQPGMGDQTALFGGGRYDGLASTMDGPASTPAVGFGMGIERVLSVVDPELGAEPSPRTYIVHLPGFSDEAFEMAEQLRRHHLGVEADVMNRSLKAQLRDAGRRCTTVVFVGGQEWENGQVAVKDLLRNTQQTLSKDEILAYLQRLS
jgi:histidyl-tRNA synthetase